MLPISLIIMKNNHLIENVALPIEVSKILRPIVTPAAPLRGVDIFLQQDPLLLGEFVI